MKYWILLSQFESPQNYVPLATMVEECGFAGILLPDHVVFSAVAGSSHPIGHLLRAPDPLEKVTIWPAEERERIVTLTAQRMKTDAVEDMRPGLLVQLAIAAGDFAFKQWVRRSDLDHRPISAYIAEALDAITHQRWQAKVNGTTSERQRIDATAFVTEVARLTGRRSMAAVTVVEAYYANQASRAVTPDRQGRRNRAHKRVLVRERLHSLRLIGFVDAA